MNGAPTVSRTSPDLDAVMGPTSTSTAPAPASNPDLDQLEALLTDNRPPPGWTERQAAPAPARRGGKSTLRLWVCRCREPVRLRIGRRHVSVRCNRCGTDFEPVGA